MRDSELTVRRIGTIPALLFLAVTGSQAHAQVIDVGRATCREFTALSALERSQMTLWLHGFYSGAALRAQIDRSRLGDLESALFDTCSRQPDLALIGSELRGLVLIGREAAPQPNTQSVPGDTAPSSPAPDRPTPAR